MDPVVLVRPTPVRAASALTLAVITAWAALNQDLSDIGVLAYPAIIALQTAREWLWRLEVSSRGLHEKQGVGGPRDIDWADVQAVVMPDSAWWRINPVVKVDGAPNIQMTGAPEVADVIAIARRKRKDVLGDPASVSATRTLLPWLVLLALAGTLLAAELAGVS
jgi:hypothetical protein